MNLVSHFTCARGASAAVRLGSMLPDLLSLYGRKVRPLPLVQRWDGETDRLPGAEGLVRGILFHHEVDSHFHRAPLFREGQAALQSRLLAASRAPGLKRFFPAHVLLEMYLDHLLIRRFPHLPSEVATTLVEGRGLMEAFIARHPAVDPSAFRRFLQRVSDDRFWEDYREHAGMFHRMNRILQRFSQRLLLPAEEQAVSAWFAAHETPTAADLDAFVAAMAQALDAVPASSAALPPAVAAAGGRRGAG